MNQDDIEILMDYGEKIRSVQLLHKPVRTQLKVLTLKVKTLEKIIEKLCLIHDL